MTVKTETYDIRAKTITICAWGDALQQLEHIPSDALIQSARRAYDVNPMLILKLLGALVQAGFFALCGCGAIVQGPRFSEVEAMLTRVRATLDEKPSEREALHVELTPDGFVQRPGKA